MAVDRAMDVLVVEDDREMSALLDRGLSAEGYRVHLAADGVQALLRAGTSVPGFAVLDVMMPGMSGFEVCRRLREIDPSIMIIMLTARDGVTDRVRGLDSGADDYLVKPFEFAELTARLRALRRREPQGTGAAVLECGDLVLDTVTHAVVIAGVPVHLSPKEFALLRLLVQNAGETVARATIMTEIWGTIVHADENIVDQYVSYVRKKIDPVSQSVRIVTERGVGFRLVDER